MILSQYMVWFSLFGLLGWVFESVYCSIVEKRWCNRGFLFGPLCPIYGVGAVAAIVVFGSTPVRAANLPAWAVFVICAVGASCIEWVTSVSMEHLFGTVWWDYSDMPLNLKGRVCVPAAIAFGLCGLGVTYLAIPLVDTLAARVPALAFELAALLLMAALAADTTLTVCTLTEVLEAVSRFEEGFNQRVQGAVDAAAETVGSAVETGRAVPAAVRTGAERVRSGAELVRDGVREGSDDLAERMRDLAGHLNARQQHILLNARRFSNKRVGATAMRLRETLDAILRKRERDDGSEQ